jgi:23S rRNA pseudouridine1911/1915/1917 synthase
MHPTILHETKDFLVVNKPAGLIVHSDGKTDEPTLVDWLLQQYPDIDGVGEQWENDAGEIINRSGIVHRLDRDTSGGGPHARHVRPS